MTQTATGPAGPAAPPRPATVTVAFALQAALVGTLLLMIATAVAQAIRYDALIDRAARAVGGSADDAALERSMNLSGTLAVAVPALVLAVWLGIAAVRLRRGSNVARILSLVGLGAPLLLAIVGCLVGGVFGVLMVGLLASGPDEFLAEDGTFPEEEFPGEFGTAFYDELARLDTGGWSIAFEVTGMTATGLALLLGIATGILLLTGPSDRYFRPRHEEARFPYPPPPPWPAPGHVPPPFGQIPPPYWYAGPPPPYPPHPGPPPGYPPPPPPG